MSIRQKIAGAFLTLGLIISFLGVVAMESDELEFGIALTVAIVGAVMSLISIPISGVLHNNE